MREDDYGRKFVLTLKSEMPTFFVSNLFHITSYSEHLDSLKAKNSHHRVLRLTLTATLQAFLSSRRFC